MSEKENKYHERYVRWQDKTREQLSFFNNLLLTLSVGFLSFAYKNFLDQKIEFNLSHPKLSTTLLVFSIVSISISIFVGLLCVINRLYDFRITTHINQIRYWVWKHSNTELDESSSPEYNKCERRLLTISLFCCGFKRIKIEECKEFKNACFEKRGEFSAKFKKLRTLTHNLGIGTWNRLNWQIGLFFVGILLFVVAQLYNN
jgi:hypothetical protein